MATLKYNARALQLLDPRAKTHTQTRFLQDNISVRPSNIDNIVRFIYEDIETISASIGITQSFASLTDTPNNYSAASNLLIGVNSGETGIEYKSWAISSSDLYPSSAGGNLGKSGKGVGKLYFDTSGNIDYEGDLEILSAGTQKAVFKGVSGYLGLGVTTPLEPLHSSNGIVIGNSVQSSGGTIRFASGDFQGYDGSSWKSFTTTSSDYFNKTTDDTDDITEGATNLFMSPAQETKINYITVTQAVDLDQMEIDVAANNAKIGITDGDKGDIIVSVSGTIFEIDLATVTLAKMANLPANRIIGNITGGFATPQALTGTQVTSMLDYFTASLRGVVPASGGGTTNFLRADGTWAPAAGFTGSGTTNYVARWTSATTIATGLIQDDGSTLSIGTALDPTITLVVLNTGASAGTGIAGYSTLTSTGNNVGVSGQSYGTAPSGTNIGGFFFASGGLNNYALKLQDGTEGAGKFLKSIDANGNANWATISISDVSGTITDTTAIHDNVAGEIAAIATKASPTGSDYLLIEDAADSNNKKKITISSLGIGGGSVTGSGTTNYVSKWTSATAQGDSQLRDDGTTLSIGSAPISTSKFYVLGSTNAIITADNNGTGSYAAAFSGNVLGAATTNVGLDLNVYTATSVNIGARLTVGASGTASATASTTYGIITSARSTTQTNIGGYFEAIGANSGTNVGVYGVASGGTNNYAARFVDGTEGTGKFLKCIDANGNAQWATVSGATVGDADYGDITVSSSGTVWTIDNGVITNSKLANAAAYSIKGNLTAAPAAPTDFVLADLSNTLPDSADFVLGFESGGSVVKFSTSKLLNVMASGTSSAVTASADADSMQTYFLTAQAGPLTVAAPSGTPDNTQQLIYRIKDDGTSRAITWDVIFSAVGISLPTATVVGSTQYLVFRYNSATTKWELASYNLAPAIISDGDKGDITVSSSGATWTIDNSAVTLAKMADVATSTVFYRKTAGTGVPEVQTLATLKTDLGLTGTNSGDQTITLTGDVTGSGTGSFAATIANNAVTNAKLNDMATQTIKGRTTAGTGDPEDLTAAQVRTILNVADGAKPKPTLTKTIVLESPADADYIPIFRTDVAITIVEALGMLAAAGSVQVRLYWDTDYTAAGATAIGTATTLTTTSEASVNIASDPTIPANSWIFLDIGTVSTAQTTVVDIRYTED